MPVELPANIVLSPPGSSFLDALTPDLTALDERLRRAIDRLRRTQPDNDSPAHRGLVIDEDNVDAWLTNLGVAGAGESQGDTLPVGLPGNEGGRLRALGDLFGLGYFERALLLTVLAPEVDVAYANLYAYAQDDVTCKYATLALVASLWGDGTADRIIARGMLDPTALLRRHLLVSIDDSLENPTSLLSRPLLLDGRIASFLLGSNAPDQALAEAVTTVMPGERQGGLVGQVLSDNQMRSLAELAFSVISASASAANSPNRQEPPAANAPANRQGLVVWMRGPERQSKRLIAAQLASALDRPLLIVDTPMLTATAGDPRKRLYRVLREARLQGALLFWADADALLSRREDTGADSSSLLAQLLVSSPACSLFDIRTALPLHMAAGPLSIELDFPAPSNISRQALWERALGGATRLAADVDLPLLTGAFRLTGEQIEAAARTARQTAIWRAASSRDSDDLQITMRDLLMACRSHSNQGLGMLSKKIVPRYTWNDLVLPADRLTQLREMTHHIRYAPIVFEQWGFDRKLSGGKGLNVLFAGPPGTGKTMAAEVLATDLGLDLYKIDLSSIVSKYIGETEKNLENIFKEGGTSNAILFFDEADSLFGKRSQVKDSHDRYANIEISYLLQRMEEYDGIVILATNLRRNLDDAFIRRLHGAIEFPMPEEPDRLEIWRRTFPPEAPLDPNADLQFLANKFKLSGGNIKNIVLEAAFFAAESGTDITMTHLVRATRREHQKIGKLITASDFGPYASLLAKEEIGG